MTAPTLTAWPGLMSREKAAAYLDVSPRHLDQLQAKRLLTPVKAHAGKRFAIEELDRYRDSLPEWDAAS